MAITYPIALPTAQGFRRVTIAPRSNVAIYASPFTGQQQVYQHPGQFLTASIELPPMDRASAADFVAAMLSLQGSRGTFYFGDPAWTSPRGVGTGLPKVKGANQTGNTIVTTGWTASQSSILRAGDWLQIGSMNLLLRSQEFDNAAWTKGGGVTVTANAADAPDGTTTADRLIQPNAVNFGAGTAVVQAITKPATALRYTATAYVKAEALNAVIFRIDDGSAGACEAYWNLATGTLITSNNTFPDFSTAIQSVGGGWHRVSITIDSTTAASLNFYLYPFDTILTAGDGTSGILIWGAQIEKGPHPHAYQVTTSTAIETAPQLSCVVQSAGSDGSGDATLEIVPRVRTAFADNTPITVVNPWGLWRMTDDGSFLQDVDSLTRGIVINAVEAF
jgi:hypothetical protein